METYQLLRDPIGRVLGGVQHCPELSHEHPVGGKIFSRKQVNQVHLAYFPLRKPVRLICILRGSGSWGRGGVRLTPATVQVRNNQY